MTSSPVKGVGFGLSGAMPTESVATGINSVQTSGFQTIWNNHTEKQTDSSKSNEDYRTVKNKPGDSLRARDEHMARTNKWEPSRNVEERTDIPEEKLEEAMEVLGTAANQLIQQLSELLGKSPEEIQGIMDDLGMKLTDILDTGNFTQLFLATAGVEEPTALVTDGGLYETYQNLMGQLDAAVQESAKTLELEPEQINVILNQQAPEEVVPQMPVEKPLDEYGQSQETETDSTVIPEQPVQRADESTAAESETKDDSGEKREQAKDRSVNSGREQENGLFSQEMKNVAQPETPVQTVYSTGSAWDVDTQNIMRQIMDYMKVNLGADLSSVEMQLHPANLGTLQIQVVAKGGVMTANFITENEAVKAALESQMIQLQQQFDEQGVRVDAIEVTVQTHQFEQNLEQGRGSSHGDQEPAKKQRVRRIDLSGEFLAEELEEEDSLTADLMKANGNTVDYTA